MISKIGSFGNGEQFYFNFLLNCPKKGIDRTDSQLGVYRTETELEMARLMVETRETMSGAESCLEAVTTVMTVGLLPTRRGKRGKFQTHETTD